MNACIFPQTRGICEHPARIPDGDPASAIASHRKSELSPAFEAFHTDVANAPDPAALVRLASALDGLWLHDVATPADAAIDHRISDAADALTRHLLRLSEAELGPPPVAYAWIAYGSQGRRELGPGSDQDNALVLADGYRAAQHGDYFARLADKVCNALAACGFVLCPGKMMASNPAWRLRSSDWASLFHGWITASDRHQARLAGNFFDLRLVAGEAGLLLPLFATIGTDCPRHDSLLAHWIANAWATPPALGIFRRFLLDAAGKLDLKHSAIIPLVELARIHALSAGIAEPTGTLSRLQAAGGQRWLSAAGSRELVAAWQFVCRLRRQHQLQSLLRVQTPNNLIDPDQLSPGDQEKLRNVLHLLTLHRRALRQIYPHMPA